MIIPLFKTPHYRIESDLDCFMAIGCPQIKIKKKAWFGWKQIAICDDLSDAVWLIGRLEWPRVSR